MRQKVENRYIEILQANQMFTKRYMHFLTKHSTGEERGHEVYRSAG